MNIKSMMAAAALLCAAVGIPSVARAQTSLDYNCFKIKDSKKVSATSPDLIDYYL
jgi:hypothetical protein